MPEGETTVTEGQKESNEVDLQDVISTNMEPGEGSQEEKTQLVDGEMWPLDGMEAKVTSVGSWLDQIKGKE